MAHANRPGQTVAHRKTIFTSPSRLPRLPRLPPIPAGDGIPNPKPRVQIVESGGELVLQGTATYLLLE